MSENKNEIPEETELKETELDNVSGGGRIKPSFSIEGNDDKDECPPDDCECTGDCNDDLDDPLSNNGKRSVI